MTAGPVGRANHHARGDAAAPPCTARAQRRRLSADVSVRPAWLHCTRVEDLASVVEGEHSID
jgi:hypothetical protein